MINGTNIFIIPMPKISYGMKARKPEVHFLANHVSKLVLGPQMD